ncbi:MAG TPA: hypothetical protein VF006_24080 [Longimicrobium sp.]
MIRFVLLLATAIAAVPLPLCAQQGRDALHVEIFGAALMGSVNYERLLTDHLSARAGMGYFPRLLKSGDRLHGPLMATVRTGRGEHQAEAGAGVVLVYGLTRSPEEGTPSDLGWQEPYATASLGYRFEAGAGRKREGGIYRVVFSPFYDGELHPFVGVSVGFYLSALR